VYLRFYEGRLEALLQKGKVLVLYGPRRAGKTFLVQRFLQSDRGKVFQGVGEDITLREILESESVQKIKSSFSGYDLIVIDEAQKVSKIGFALKLLVDHVPEAKVIATGSSSFDLANRLGEPLTGRKQTITLFPVSALELKEQFGPLRIAQLLEELLVFGTYPETLAKANLADKASYLSELRDAYLCKDILELENIKNSRKLLDLLTLLAFQIGGEVSHHELGRQLGLSKQTVERYLDLLEKAFVIRNVRGFSRNLRKEVTKTSRYYFLDNGVRNSVINNFNALALRNDVGQLWENFMFMERLKKRQHHGILANFYFWRTYDQQEIDLVEEREGKLFAYEFKYSRGSTRPPRAWLNAYPDSEFMTVNRDNYLEFVT